MINGQKREEFAVNTVASAKYADTKDVTNGHGRDDCVVHTLPNRLGVHVEHETRTVTRVSNKEHIR